MIADYYQEIINIMLKTVKNTFLDISRQFRIQLSNDFKVKNS